ncbi:phosphoenolpyruvate carboxykinase [ATP] [Methylacidiphilum kamchatkense Kam1]|uniref:Phosphoenolpyruvate carboxykinase (ATP) n=1 Tax=Methylacidiphilum kamchatkense Kam1 TaxID=1202785 RepID=A0A0C1UQL4_9BACT|nr:phosphoenolpyruvate carboxykinase (ATP) [Methylacidiphilum kamchatkense]KIE58148.1 phosphoenolpyruvate carboxykinase [ATP] [Methylacidiphilum kamchatkense Kam1]QDQ42159.1 phosphoenolpyruvate carboxykinase (ATP) [Methylacidiphilum kamchatkense Kam1]
MNKDSLFEMIQLKNVTQLYWDLSVAELYEQAIKRHEALLSASGSLVFHTGQYKGRTPKDKFIVKDQQTTEQVDWGKINQPFDPLSYKRLKSKVLSYLQDRDLFIQRCYACSNPNHRINLWILSERPIYSLFSRNLFIVEKDPEKRKYLLPDFILIHAPGFRADPETDKTQSGAFIILNFDEKMILIGGTGYAGEIKKAVFTVLNFLLPQKGVFPMHCSANFGKDPQDSAIFFGLSGTGKTTLSIDSTRYLIGDDEHGWDDSGVFNVEGGCYAKVIRISKEGEPEIYQAALRFGTILENVIINPQTREIDFNDDSLTENTRAAFPIEYIPNASGQLAGGHPKNIIMLCCDAFGVLPPVAKLNPEQALYYFLLGYTAKIAGTETGIQEPTAVFSPCFGSPFLPLPPKAYARMFKEKIEKHKPNVWLLNTGWTGGPYGIGKRIALETSRRLVRAILSGELAKADFIQEEYFHFSIPQSSPDVPTEILHPSKSWKDLSQYEKTARELQALFEQNYHTLSLT